MHFNLLQAKECNTDAMVSKCSKTINYLTSINGIFRKSEDANKYESVEVGYSDRVGARFYDYTLNMKRNDKEFKPIDSKKIGYVATFGCTDDGQFFGSLEEYPIGFETSKNHPFSTYNLFQVNINNDSCKIEGPCSFDEDKTTGWSSGKFCEEIKKSSHFLTETQSIKSGTEVKSIPVP